MLEKKNNIIIVISFLALFSGFYALSFFGTDIVTGGFSVEKIMDKTFDDDIDVMVSGKAQDVVKLLGSIGGLDSLDLPQGSNIFSNLVDQLYIKGEYNYTKDRDIHSGEMTFTDASHGMDLASIQFMYSKGRIYLKAQPLFQSSYYYDFNTSLTQDRDMASLVEKFVEEFIDRQDRQIDFVLHEGYDGKSSYVYEMTMDLMTDEQTFQPVILYVKPEGQLLEIDLGREEALSIYFIDCDFALDESDFKDAKAYDLNSLADDLRYYSDAVFK